MSENGRKRLQELANTVREKVAASGDNVLHKKGLLQIELLARDLQAPDGMPGLRLTREAPSKFKLVRAQRNGSITLEWQRDIGCIVMTAEKNDGPKVARRYVYDEPKDLWRYMDGVDTQELYDELLDHLTEYLYPEALKKE
jgi:hypothetical protein